MRKEQKCKGNDEEQKRNEQTNWGSKTPTGRKQKWQGNGEESDKFCWRCERTPVGATLRTKELKAVKTAWPEEYERHELTGREDILARITCVKVRGK